jgi:hypothetical protein
LNKNAYSLLGGKSLPNCSKCNKCIKTIDIIPCRCVCSINNTELTLNGVTKTDNCCGINLKIDYTISCSYQDNKCQNTSICKECSLTYLIPNCCNSNVNPVVNFECLDIEQISNNMILVKAKCNIVY